ncbi:hypothetical protein Y032_0960g3219 [Ancylostoma ceylanicum]|nr:hypothetical protein Y032_0960g3219 [Ancylostoma ceylanicum]
MDRVRLVDVLLLAVTLLGHFTSALPHHQLFIPGDPRIQDIDRDDGPEDDIPARIPDDISVTEYYIKIQPYYPAPGIQLDKGRNMTFDGSVSMSVKIVKPTSEIILNAANLKIVSIELTDFLKRPVVIKEMRLNNETEQLSFVLQKRPRVGSVFVLAIKYTGKINPYYDAGLYYTYYEDSEGEVHWMVATQLAPFSARTVFPCMDEPAFKAIFHVELVYPSSHVALGNMKETPPVDLGNGWSKVSFPPTPVMSTYLVAFSSGPYVSHSVINKDGTLVRSWGWTGQENFLKFSAETAGECLHQMGLYTNIKFPLEKCDHLGLPEFLAGAMENFGLIVYKYQFISFNPDAMTTLDKIGAALVICHEVSHQWFGDLVTAECKDSLLGSFQEAATVRIDREKALARDGSAYTHPLIAVDGPHFDPITYEKGQMLLRMLADTIDEEVLRSGLQNYLRAHQYSTASHWDLWSGLTEVSNDAGVRGWHGPLNVTELMEPYALQSSFPVINVHAGKTGISFSQERFNDISTQSSSPWNYTWIIPLRTAEYSSPGTTIRWLVPDRFEEPLEHSSQATNRWHVVSHSSATYGRVVYDENSLHALLQKIAAVDVPVGVKIALIGDEVAMIKRNKSIKQPYSYHRLLDILATMFNTPSKEDPSSQLVDIALPQMEFFANLLRDSIDAPLIEQLFGLVFGKAYKSEIWDAPSSWNADAMKNIFLPYAVRYSIGDASSTAQKFFNQIAENCKSAESNNGSAWCSKVPNDIHRAAYCGAAKYDNNLGANFARLLFLYNGEVKTNPYYYQEYTALLEGMACTERAPQLKTLIRLLIASPHRPSMIFGWLKTNPKASEALYLYLKTKSDSVLRYTGLSYYLDAMVYNWRSERRLRQFNELHKSLLPKLNNKQKDAFAKFEKKIRDNIEWSKQHLPSIMRWMYDNLVVVGKAPWRKSLPGIISPERYDVEITPYIPGSGKYHFSKNMTFDGSVKMKFTVTQETSEIVVNAHRMVIDVDSIVVKDSHNSNIEVSAVDIAKDYEHGILKIPLATKIVPGLNYSMSISYTGFIFDKLHHGVHSNYNFYEFNGKQGWIFSTDFEGGPGSRSLMVCCDEPSYKALFHISVRHPADMTALSNMFHTGTTVLKEGWAVTRFRETPKMSTHLLAICVGHFASLSAVSETGVLVRAFSWTGMEIYADFSLKIMAGAMDYMNDYFNYKFPLSKLDVVALPQHADRGATGKWGLILGSYKSLIVDKDYADAKTLANVAITVARAVVQQWFGGLASMEWWSEIFLSNGFAEYFATNGVNHVMPEQREYLMNYAPFYRTSVGLWDDCRAGVSVPVISEDEGLFTSAVNQKASSLLHTLSNTIWEATFLKGIRTYLTNNAYRSANPEELWNTLTEACSEAGVPDWDGKDLDVSTFMKNWTTKVSFPIVKVSTGRNGLVTYRQESCLGDDTTWYIPIVSVSEYNEELNWFVGKDGSSPVWQQPSPLSRVDNVGGNSFVRIYYDKITWKSMLRNMDIANDAATQGTLLRDAWFFVSKGNYSWPQFLDLVNVIQWDDSLIKWTTGLEFFEELYHRFRFHDSFPRITIQQAKVGRAGQIGMQRNPSIQRR